MFIIKCGPHTEVWSNKPGDNFLQYVPKYFSNKYGIPVAPEDLEVHYCEDSEALRHFDAHPQNGVELKAGRLDLLEYKPPKIEKPSLREGDDDPDNPGTPVGKGDPRTEKKLLEPEKLEKKKDLPVKKLKAWPYNKEGTFTGNKF